MSKTKKAPLFSTSNTIHSDVLCVQNLPQKSKKQSTIPHINCTNNKREVNKRKHIVLSLLIAVATILMVACPPEPTNNKGSTSPQASTIKQLLGRLTTVVKMPETNQIEKKKKQQEIQNILKKIKGKDPAYKHKPTTKDELSVFIKAEVWGQGIGGKQNWKADLNNIDTSLITDMSYLFSFHNGYGLGSFNGNIKDWDVSSVTNMSLMFYGAKAFKGDISMWDVSSVTTMSLMFGNIMAFKQDLDDWAEHLKNADSTYKRIDIQEMFRNSKVSSPPSWYPEIKNQKVGSTARTAIKQLLDDLAKDVESHTTNGDEFYNKGNYKASEESYKQAIKLDRKDAKARYGRGLARVQLHKYYQAIDDLNEGIKLDPDYAKSLLKHKNAYYNRGLAKSMSGKHVEAIKDYDIAIKATPDLIIAHIGKGIALYKQKKYSEATKAYTKAIDLNSNDAHAYNNRGLSQDGEKKYDEAILDYDKAIKINLDFVEAYSNRGYAKLEKGDIATEKDNSQQATKYYKNAMADFDLAIKKDKTHLNAYYNRGTTKIALKKYGEAIKDFDKAIEINPDFAKAYHNRAHANYKLGNKLKMSDDINKRKEKESTAVVVSGTSIIPDNTYKDNPRKIKTIIFDEPSYIETIGASAFEGNCLESKTIAIPTSVIFIGTSAFKNTCLETVFLSETLSDTLKSFGKLSDVFGDTVKAYKIYPKAAVWKRVARSAKWSGRWGHTTVVFNDKIWVLGGNDSSNKHDVWSSSDGKTWKQETAKAGWSGRRGHTTVVFGGKIWVLGGWDGSYKNDVWSSGDGKTWTLEKKHTTGTKSWSGRWGHTTAVFGGKIWVLGGWDGSNKHDVWSSSDGKTWKQETAKAGWSGREHHTTVVFGGKIWVLGGNDGSNKNDVWSSSDGKTWTQVTDVAKWSGRRGHTTVVFGGKIWVLGGWDSSNKHDVWSSSDGKTWTKETIMVIGTTKLLGRKHHTTVEFGGKIWVLGGEDDDGINKNDVLTYDLP